MVDGFSPQKESRRFGPARSTIWYCRGILDSLIETKIHNTASFYPQNRGPGSLRQKQGTACVLPLIR